MQKCGKLHARHSGAIALYLFIPILTAAAVIVAACFALASKEADFYTVCAKNAALQNCFEQADAIAFDRFENAVKSGLIEIDYSSAAKENPKTEIDAAVLKEITEANGNRLKTIYAVDENYADSYTLQAQKLGIPQRAPEYIYDASTSSGYNAARYMLVYEMQPDTQNSQKLIYTTEILVMQKNGTTSVKKLYSSKKYITD